MLLLLPTCPLPLPHDGFRLLIQACFRLMIVHTVCDAAYMQLNYNETDTRAVYITMGVPKAYS